MVSDNAYLSIVTTNKCQFKCSYCINSETDHSLDFPVEKGASNIEKLVSKYNIKEAILLGGEPTLHPDIIKLIGILRTTSGLKMLRLTTNGKKLTNKEFLKELVNENFGVQGLNISFHNEDFITLEQLKEIVANIRVFNPKIKIRVNSNIWRGNLDTTDKLYEHFEMLNFVDEFRISNIIPKDNFSVNPINHDKSEDMILSDSEYEKIFSALMEEYEDVYTIFENPDTLGFVKYFLIPTKRPIIVNWNLNSNVSDQACENDIVNRKINTFKSLVSGDISLSWNETNKIKL